MPCTLEWKYFPHACTQDQVKHCNNVKCPPKKCCGCTVIAELKFDCSEWVGWSYYAWGGRLDIFYCACKYRHPARRIRKRRRQDFRRRRSRLIKLWEETHGAKWPIDPETGRGMDAHHIQPIFWDGDNTLGNLVPLPRAIHDQVHALYRRLYANC